MSRAWYNHALLLLCFLVFFPIETTLSQIHYVSKSGSNTPPYISWKTAAHKIQDAINASNRGDTVLIGVGNYYDSIKVDRPLTIIGERVDETIIRGDSVFGWQTFMAYDTCRIEGISVITRDDSLSTKSSYGIGAYRFITITNCIVKNSHHGISVCGEEFEISNVILTNIIVGCSFCSTISSDIGRLTNANIVVKRRNGAPWQPSATTWVDYGTFHIDRLTALNITPLVETGVMNSTSSRGGSLVNSSISNFWSTCVWTSAESNSQYLIENCVLNGGLYGVEMDGHNLKVFNTVLLNNKDAGISIYGTYTGDYNLYFNNGKTGTGTNYYQGEHDIIANPMFVNATEHQLYPPVTEFDYHLQYGSPAIDAGAPWLLDADGSRSDIGVFGGPGGSSYPYQDLPPLAPKWISSKVENKTVTLKWKKNGERDYLKSYLHRSTVQGYTPDSTTIIAVLDGSTLTDTATYTDTLPSYAIPYYYRLQSEDSTGHLGNPGNVMAVTAVSIRENSTTELFDYRLEQNYPNPFNATTMIPFSLKEEGSVTISLYTMTGEKVATLASSHYAKGSYEVNADLGHLASGIYLYRIEVHNENRIPVFRDMKKLVLVK